MGLPLGIDARAAAEVPAGRGRFVRSLLEALAALPAAADERFILYARRRWGDLDPERFEWRLSNLRDPLWHAAVARASATETSCFLSTNSYITPILSTGRVVTMVYDLVPFVVPDVARSQSTIIERTTLGLAARRSRHLICISRATETDLIERFSKARGKSSVALLAADPVFSPSTTRADAVQPFVLAVGTFEPRKNLRRLVDAWNDLESTVRAGRRLVLVGPDGWGDSGIDPRAISDSVYIEGHISEARLIELYRTCHCFVYPSLYEGFGLPILEAMASGAPVITSNVSSMPEVAGDAAFLVDPLDSRAITQALRSVLTDPALRAELSDRGLARARSFSWQGTAEAVLASMRSVAA